MSQEHLGEKIGVIILAAGKGTRMESEKSKVLHPVAGFPMLQYVLDAAKSLNPERVAVVIGHQGDQVQSAFEHIPDVAWVRQTEMLGTGDAVRCAAEAFTDFVGPVLILYGDIPGIKSETLRRLSMVHRSSENTITLLTAELDDPTGYGRIIASKDGSVSKIVEETEASPSERRVREINTGIGIYESRFLFAALRMITADNQKGEFYLTDLVEAARRVEKDVGRHRLKDASETLGINDRESLAEVSMLTYDQKASELLQAGVTLVDPSTTYIESTVDMGKDSIIQPNVTMSGDTQIGERSLLGNSVELRNVIADDGVQVGQGTVLHDVEIGSGSQVGSYVVIKDQNEEKAGKD